MDFSKLEPLSRQKKPKTKKKKLVKIQQKILEDLLNTHLEDKSSSNNNLTNQKMPINKPLNPLILPLKENREPRLKRTFT